MIKYFVVISESAQQDLRDLSNVIRLEYKSPHTAIKYLREVYVAMRKLELVAEISTIQTRNFFLRYGLNVRRLNYKKITIIYTVIGKTVYIQRVMPSSTITD